MSKRLTHCDLCQHNNPAALGGYQQLARGSLPMRFLLLCLWKSRNVAAGIFQSRESAAIEQGNGRVKRPRPINHHVSRLFFDSALGDEKKWPRRGDTEAD
jgi:hypothetical protein